MQLAAAASARAGLSVRSAGCHVPRVLPRRHIPQGASWTPWCDGLPRPMCHLGLSKASRGFEPRSLDSESRVLTVTPRGQLIIGPAGKSSWLRVLRAGGACNHEIEAARRAPIIALRAGGACSREIEAARWTPIRRTCQAAWASNHNMAFAWDQPQHGI